MLSVPHVVGISDTTAVLKLSSGGWGGGVSVGGWVGVYVGGYVRVYVTRVCLCT